MKDDKGHGSDGKGAHSAGVEAATKDQFTPAQLDALRSGFNGISTVDPDGESYKKMTGMLDKMSQDQLKYLSGAGIKFVSKLAGNRVQRTPGAPAYNAGAVNNAIASSNRAGRRIGGREASMIHALLKGRH